MSASLLVADAHPEHSVDPGEQFKKDVLCAPNEQHCLVARSYTSVAAMMVRAARLVGIKIMIAYLDTVDSPAGLLTFAVDATGALVRLHFVDSISGCTIVPELERAGYAIAADQQRTAQLRTELMEYSMGSRQTFDIPLVLAGTAWQNAVWSALTRIPYGETRSYAEVAAMIGRPLAARAVGRANATNKLPLVVPCHRVIGADGSLTGFAGGLHLKMRLLAHEAMVLGRPALSPTERAAALAACSPSVASHNGGISPVSAGSQEDRPQY